MYYKINESLTKEENIKAAAEYSAKAKELLANIEAAVKEGFKFVPRYGNTKTQAAKLAAASEVIDRLRSASSSEYSVKSTYDHRERMVKEAEEKKARESATAERLAATQSLLNEAIAYLFERGQKIGTDFTVETAIDCANHIAFEEECKRREEHYETPISFSGQNCEDECAGWVPGNRRCECGNRRVSWTEGYGHSFKAPDVWAEAY